MVTWNILGLLDLLQRDADALICNSQMPACLLACHEEQTKCFVGAVWHFVNAAAM